MRLGELTVDVSVDLLDELQTEHGIDTSVCRVDTQRGHVVEGAELVDNGGGGGVD